MSNTANAYQDKKNINAVLGIKHYVHRMLSDGSAGGKALLVDEDTLPIVSLVYSQTELLEAEVYDVSILGDDRPQNRAAHQHLRCVVFIRPQDHSVRELVAELQNPRYGSYDVHFSNIVEPGVKSAAKAHLQNLAEADSGHLVNSVQEFYGDYFAMQDVLFSMEQLDDCPNYTNRKRNEYLRDRTVQGISSFFLAHKRPACVRYQTTSRPCMELAGALDTLVRVQENSIHGFQTRQGTPLLLLMDRCEDPISPLIKPWTYQAMLHEYVGIKLNTVDLRPLMKGKAARGNSSEGAPAEMEDKDVRFVLAPGWAPPSDKQGDSSQDDFYARQMYNDFATVSDCLKVMVEEYQSKSVTGLTKDADISLDALKKLVEDMPEIRHRSGIVGKHLSMMQQFKDQLDTRDIWDSSELEQELISDPNMSKGDARDHIMELAGRPGCKVGGDDLLRLVMLWALKYDDSSDRPLMNMLKERGVHNADEMVDSLLDYAGSDKRSSWNNLMKKQSKRERVSRILDFMKDIPDVNKYLRHQPLVVDLLDKAFAGQLDEEDFPFQSQGHEIQYPTEVVLFIVGGATYCEAAAVAHYNKTHSGKRVVLGGSCLHNSDSFLELIRQQAK